MVLLTTTPTIIHAISLLPPASDLTTSFHHLPIEPGHPISHTILIRLSKCTSYTLNTLLRGTHHYITPSPPKPEPSPEYKALMARLREEEERKTYNQLLKQQEEVSLQAQSAESMQPEEKDDISPSLVLNILLSIVMCAAVAFHLTRWWSSDGIRVLVSLGTGIIVGVAEVVVYSAYLRKVEESRRKERSKREKKVLIGEYTGDENAAVEAWGEKKEIEGERIEVWGKGIHGGMRRRLREKWEREQEQSEKE